MRYFFISDVHGCFNKMKAALDAAGFNSSTDTIVSLGDPFDRGPQSWEVLEFLMSCPNRILVWGNHDLRLRKLLLGRSLNIHDYSNGVLETMKSFCGNSTLTNISVGINVFLTDDNYRDRCKLLWHYFDECCFAVEFKDLVGTHAWIPTMIDYNKTSFDKWGYPLSEIVYKYDEDWRDTINDSWEDTTWGNSQAMYDSKVFIPNKKLIIGHWHAWRLRCNILKQPEPKYIHDIDFSMYQDHHIIAIDGCTHPLYGQVNVYVYESDEEPIFYKPR